MMDELVKGCSFKVEHDKSDLKYDLITIRMPSATVAGGPPTPECDFQGEAARKRFIRFLLGRASGVLAEHGWPDHLIRKMMALVRTFHDN